MRRVAGLISGRAVFGLVAGWLALPPADFLAFWAVVLTGKAQATMVFLSARGVLALAGASNMAVKRTAKPLRGLATLRAAHSGAAYFLR